MEILFFIIAKFIRIYLDITSLAMIVRMLLPIFTASDDNKINEICCYISEPFVAPVRAAMYKMNIGQNSPIDWGFFAAYFLLWLLRTLLPEI